MRTTPTSSGPSSRPTSHTRTRRRSLSPTTTSWSSSSRRRSTGPRRKAASSRSSTPSSASRRRSRRRSATCTRTSSRRSRTTRCRVDAGGVLPPGLRAGLRPGDRRGPLHLPRLGRARPARVAVGPLLRRPHPQVEPGRTRRSTILFVSGQYVAYQFFRVDPAWRRLPVEERMAGKDAFAEVVEEWAGRMEALRAYSVTGVRPDSDFFLWKITERYEDLGELGAALNATPLAGWLETPYSYLATTKASQYTAARRAAEDRPARLALPRRLPVREDAAVVRALRGGPPARDGRAHPHRAPSSRRSTTTRRTRSGSTTRSS